MFVYNRCRRCIFNKPTHLGNKTKRLSFLNMLIMHLFPSFTSKYWCLDVLEQHKNYLTFFWLFQNVLSRSMDPIVICFVVNIVKTEHVISQTDIVSRVMELALVIYVKMNNPCKVQILILLFGVNIQVLNVNV